MKLLFDASALLNLVRRLGGDALDCLRGSYMLTLTPYEVANAIWKEAALLHRLSPGEAESLLSSISAAYRFLAAVEPSDEILVFRLAYALGLTYYDASYVVAAHELGASLVTDDGRLRARLHGHGGRVVELLGGEPSLLGSTDLGAGG